MKVKLIIIVIISVVVLGFVIGAILPETNSCTLLGCPCKGVSGERPCNSCSFSNHIFTTGLINVIQKCSASEIIICENNIQVNTRIDLENKKCKADWYILGFNLKYSGADPEDLVSKNIN